MIGITGGNGVIGKLISKELIKKEINFNIYKGDIRDYEELCNWLKINKISSIIHLAAKVAIKDVKNNPVEAIEVNVNGMIQLVKAITNSEEPIYLFYASTSHVYKSSDKPINENHEIDPISFYGKTKRLAEEVLIDTESELANSKLNYCIGRIFSFYHDNQNPPYLYPTLKNRFKEEDLSKPFRLFGAKSIRDFLNAEEVATIIIKIVEKKLQGVYNIGSGKGQKIIDFVTNMAPQKLDFLIDENEKTDYLVADISKLKNDLN